MRCHSCNDLIPNYTNVYMKRDCSFCSDECRNECKPDCNNELLDFRKENVCSRLFLKLKEVFIKKRTVNKTWSEQQTWSKIDL